MINVHRLCVGRDTRVVFEGVRYGHGGAYANDRSFRIAVYERTVNSTTGRPEKGDSVVTSIPMNYEALSNGRYTGIVPGSVSLTAGAWYIVEITEATLNFSEQKVLRAEYVG